MVLKQERIAELNDALRKHPDGTLGLITMTHGVASEPDGFWLKVLFKLASLDTKDFIQGNDPYRERDFCAFEVAGIQLFMKIDYYAKGSNLTLGSEAPENPDLTERVLTVMLREEY